MTYPYSVQAIVPKRLLSVVDIKPSRRGDLRAWSCSRHGGAWRSA